MELSTITIFFIVVGVLLLLGKFIGFMFRLAGVLLLVFIAYSAFNHIVLDNGLFENGVFSSPSYSYNEETQEYHIDTGSYILSGEAGESEVLVEKNGEKVEVVTLPEPVEIKDGAISFSEEMKEFIFDETEGNK